MSKEPWRYPSNVAALMRQFLQLRAQLIPYLESANAMTHIAGVPLIRPMYYGHGDESRAYQVPNEFQFGPAMVVAPITTPVDAEGHLASPAVWLPAGQWVDFFTGIHYQGDRYFQAYREQEQLPVFVKVGSIIPLNPDVMLPADALPTTLKLKIFVGADGTYELIEQVDGATATTTFCWDDTGHMLTINVADPSHIIPAQREIQPELVGATGTIVSQSQDKISFSAVTLIGDDFEVMTLIQQRLQLANLPFDLKRDVWHMVQTSPSHDQLLAYIGTLEQPSLQGMLTELLTC